MLSEIFYWFLNMSITGTIIGFVVLTLSKVIKNQRRIYYILWAIPFIRFWVPFAPVSKYGLMELITRLSERTVVLTDRSHTMAMTNHMAYADSYFPIVYKTNLIAKIFEIGSVIWLIIAVSIILVLVISYIFAKREIRNAMHYKENIWFSDKLHSPAIYGIIRPKIVMPENYKARDISFVLMHENVHIKCLDNLWRAIALITAAAHWFNPFVWLFVRSFFNEMEFSCDEKVLARCDESEYKSYALSLIESAEVRSKLVAAYTGGKLSKRIEHILTWRKMSIFGAVCFIIFASAIACVLITNPM
ncbi:MAG: M56 family metallopeptidase [Ruminococcaceae bacterium]|nr:M56 family metallopeptidase [Oscillospiraceae bacterium]